jgi:hypothetical protein
VFFTPVTASGSSKLRDSVDAKLGRPPTFRVETVDIDQIVAVMQSDGTA